MYHKWRPYHFCPFNLPPFPALNSLENQNFEKWKKNAWTYDNFPWWLGHLEILSFYTFASIWCMVHGSHMMYGSWDMDHERQCFVILDCFLPFYPPSPPPSPSPSPSSSPSPQCTQKNKFLIKWKKSLKILSFYKCVP